jgi:hypothetical protein
MGYSQYGYRPTGSILRMLGDSQRREQGEDLAFEQGRQWDQEQHERALQAQEQGRRQYDSETQRQKLGVLGNLLSGRLR